MTNAALSNDNMIWCGDDWLTPLLWQVPENGFMYAKALDASFFFFPTRMVCPAFLQQKKQGYLCGILEKISSKRKILLVPYSSFLCLDDFSGTTFIESSHNYLWLSAHYLTRPADIEKDVCADPVG